MPDRSVRPAPAMLSRDPVILAVLGFCVLAGAWYLAGWGGERARLVGFGLCLPVLNVVMAVLCRRVVRLPGLPGPTRLFGTALTCAALCAAAGDLVQVILDLNAPLSAASATATVTGTAHQVGLVVGACFPIWVMLTLPNGSGSRREKLRFWLDASTVMAGAAVFAWYVNISASVSSDAGSLAGPVVTMGVELVAAFAVVKLLLTRAAGFVREAAIFAAVGVAIEGLSAGIVPTMTPSPWLSLLVAGQMLPAAMIVLAPRIQELRVRSDPRLLASTPKRPYSLLPYLAVAATLALLVVVIADDGIESTVWVALGGVVVSTGLVVARQLAALSENASLLARLDASFRELRRQEQLLRHQASHDHLTQLANRALFAQRAAMTSGGTIEHTAVVMIDLDDFKPINDGLGHHVGDSVLVVVAERLRACVRPGDTVARLGGDEFAILLPGATDAPAKAVVQRITAALAEPVFVEGHELHVRASIGLAAGMSDDPEALLRAADDAMYSAKREARASVAGSAVGQEPSPTAP